MQTSATYDSATSMITIKKGAWLQTFPATDLLQQIAFYRLQQERFPTHADYYEDDVKALEALATQLRG